MTFGSEHYVPVLKMKQAEKEALAGVDLRLRAGITPLIEIVERKDAPISKHLDRAFKGFKPSVLTGYPRYLLDTREIAADGAPAAADAFARARSIGVPFTPVTGVNRASDILPALHDRSHGVALRVTRAEFEAGGWADGIRTFVGTHGLSPTEVDLILDLGAVHDNLITEGVAALALAFIGEIPSPRDWRTLTLSASAIRQGMGGIERHSYALDERSEWLAWRDHLLAQRARLPRMPTFSDCGIQHPLGVEGFDPQIMSASASVRYTRPEHWLIIKGEGGRKTRLGLQFPELARRLVYGTLRGHFDGVAHCAGCRSIKQAAEGPRGGAVQGLGSARVWRRIGTIHHLTVVRRALDSMSAS